MASNSNSNPLHFIFFPLMAQGHMLPMVDIAKLLAQRGAISTLLCTPAQANLIRTATAAAAATSLQIRILHLNFPTEFPQQFQFLHQIPSSDQILPFFTSLFNLQQPAESLIQNLIPPPTAVISDSVLPWTLQIAQKFNLPWISFVGSSCFAPVVMHTIYSSMIFTTVTSDQDYFTVPDLPDEIQFNKSQLPTYQLPDMAPFYRRMSEAENRAIGRIVNSFEELEPAYVQKFKKLRNRIWCVGPVSLCNEDDDEKVGRGSQLSTADAARRCLKWLDSQNSKSVIYVCLGSLCNLTALQLIELGLGLEESNRPFVWVIRTANDFEELKKWMSKTEYEERIKGRGFLIWGWAPQVRILSHRAIGGFLTHCGWNSILEGISAGVAMISWPLFSDQFVNEQQVVNVLKIAVRIGANRPVKWGKEERGEIEVKKENVKDAIDELMGEGDEAVNRRIRVRDFSEMAKKAVGEGGSSQLNITLFIDEIRDSNT